MINLRFLRHGPTFPSPPQDHFEPTDFDDRGLIQPAAVPTRFPGGVKVIYNSSGEAGGEGADQPPEEPEVEEPPEPPPIECCVPGCKTVGPKERWDDGGDGWCERGCIALVIVAENLSVSYFTVGFITFFDFILECVA